MGGVRSLIKILMEYFHENLHTRRLMNYYNRRGRIYRIWVINKYKFEFHLTKARQYTNICSITRLKSHLRSGKQTKKKGDLPDHMTIYEYESEHLNMVKRFVES